ncbi:AAA family ATPase [Belnapia rosea]|uniref:AAA family ATPase n=1 Tax=Belnapia rosea TaxID=938405 RepID=UPI00088F8D9D|nr:ATP-binding protein [Belnapia rosea]SDB74440.1 ATPase [Belnapia rosea]
MIRNLDRAAFEAVLRRTLSPSSPIRTPEFLRGRERSLEQIRRAFVQRGRQVFIYGDRGVGKTSLALTAAYEHQPSGYEPLILSCRGSFFEIARDLLNRMAQRSVLLSKETRGREFSLTQVFGVKGNQSVETVRVGEIRSLNDFMAALRELCDTGQQGRVCVFDEFELVASQDDRRLFGDFIKQLADQEVPIYVIFCGIGDSVAALLDDHPSAPRYLAAVELARLSYDAGFEIMKGAAEELGAEIEYNTRVRIATISDGFPHYVHLICEKLFWEMYECPDAVAVSNIDHYRRAVRAAVEDAQPYLRSLYDKAVRKYQRDYEHVLWAAADHPNLERRSIEIFETYCTLFQEEKARLPREKFNQRLNALKTPSHGQVLIGTRQGWYRFRESMLRGYARLKAEEEGVELTVDHPLSPRPAR